MKPGKRHICIKTTWSHCQTMTSKISMNPNKASTLMLTNIGSQKTDGQKREFSYGFMKDYITKSVRGTRYFDTVQSMASVVKPSPLCMASQSYDELFKNLVESCRSFFTKEYGKNEEDYNKFVENCTKIYETPKRHESNLIIERIKFFKSENEPKIRSKVSLLSIKKSRLSVISRHKLKGDLMKSRIKMTSAMKRTRSLIRRPKKTRRGDLYGPMIERSLSDFLDVSDEDQQQKETPNKENKKIKPFVYKLSDPEMIKKGFTVNFQPPVRLLTFRACPSSFRPFWFQSRSWVLERYYPNNFVSWRHSKEGNGTVFYENGEPAIVFVLGRIGPVIIVYSKSQKIRDVTIKQFPVALFDTKGNGIVYDKKTGKKRLIYDQAEGIWLDSPSKYPIPWKWKSYDQVMCRRAELKFVSPTLMDDFNYEITKTHNLKHFESMQRKLRYKQAPSIWESRKSKFRKKSRRTDYLQMMRMSKLKKRNTFKKSNTRSEASDVSLRKGSKVRPNAFLRDIDIPKLLRFVGRGFIIKPVLTPCEDMEPITINIATLCQPSTIIPLDSAVPSQRASSLARWAKTTSIGRSKQYTSIGKDFGKLRTKASFGFPEFKRFLEPLTRCKYKETLCLLKPIVLNLTDNISLTITDQEHIHIDFISPPVHYSFNIGVKIAVEKVDSIFDVRIPTVDKEPILSVLEALNMKCPILYDINKTVKNLRSRVLQKSRRDLVKKLKAWGQDKYLGKVPPCKLMNNKCSCRDCSCIPLNLETK